MCAFQVYVYSSHISDVLYPRIYRSANAVVLPTRGEGWGRPQIEAMAMGLPLITTNWSGPTAFINDDVAYPLAVDRLVNISNSGYGYFDEGNQQWAEPSTAHLRQLMRRVLQQPAEAAAKGAAARARILRLFSPQARIMLLLICLFPVRPIYRDCIY